MHSGVGATYRATGPVDGPGVGSRFHLEGEPHCWTKVADSGGKSDQFTCPECTGWTHTRTESSPSLTIVRSSTLDDHPWVRPVAQNFTRSALPWALMPIQFSYETEFKDTTPLEQAFAIGAIRPGAPAE